MYKYRNLVEAIQDASRLKDKGIIFIQDKNTDVFVSYEQLYKRAKRVLYILQSKGLTAGRELIFQIQDNEQFIYVFWACLLGGIIPVPVSVGNNVEHKLKPLRIWNILHKPALVIDLEMFDDLQKVGNQNDLHHVFGNIKENTIYIEDIFKCDTNDLPSEEGAIFEPLQDDIAFIQYSSGSTGNPKGVTLTHNNLIANITAVAYEVEMSCKDSFISWLPLTHDMGMIGAHLTPLLNHMNQCIMATQLFIRMPTLWLKKATEYKVSVLLSPNFGYQYYLSHFSPVLGENLDLSACRLVFNGAEPISYELCNEFLDTMEQYGLKRESMFTVYGMAEASVAVAFPKAGEVFKTVFIDRRNAGMGDTVLEVNPDNRNAIGFVEEGHAVDFCMLRVCDAWDIPVDDRVIGEIQIRGANVTSGYYNNPDANEKLFTKDGWVKTGDLGFLRDGRLVVTGRIKDIIFVNGQNFYPHDIERVLEGLEEIQTGRVVATSISDSRTKTESIVIFVLFKKSSSAFLPLNFKIKEYIREKMGLFVKEVVPVRKIYKTTSGKIQRYKLAQMYEMGEFAEVIAQMDEARKEIACTCDSDNETSEVKNAVLKLCQDIFKEKNIGLQNSFFEFEANSLKLASLSAAIHEAFNVEVPLACLFQFSTIRELAEYVERCNDKSIYAAIETPARNHRYPEGYYETSAAQRRLHVVDQIDLDTIGPNIGYNMPEALLIEGKLDPEKVNEAFITLLNRHEALRTAFEIFDGEPVQKVYSSVPFRVGYYEGDKRKVNEMMGAFVRPFQLDKPPLIRAALVRIEENKHILMLDMHHIISDGWSVMVIIKELLMLLEGEKPTELKIQFKEFAAWQNKLLSSDAIKSQEEYWLGRFPEHQGGTIPILNMPTDFQRPPHKTYAGDRVIITAQSSILDGLNRVGQATASTLHMIMLAIYTVLLSKYSGQEDIIVGSPIAGRSYRPLKNVFGMFVNMLVNRNMPKHDMTFRAFLTQVKENCLNAYQNQDYQFDELVGKLKLKRDMSRNPLFDYVFSVQNLDMPDMKGSQLKVYPYDFEYTISRFDMFLSIMTIGESTRFMLEYSTSLFKRSTAETFLNHYMEMMKQVEENIDIRLEDITLSHNLAKAESAFLICDEDTDFDF